MSECILNIIPGELKNTAPLEKENKNTDIWSKLKKCKLLLVGMKT